MSDCEFCQTAKGCDHCFFRLRYVEEMETNSEEMLDGFMQHRMLEEAERALVEGLRCAACKDRSMAALHTFAVERAARLRRVQEQLQEWAAEDGRLFA